MNRPNRLIVGLVIIFLAAFPPLLAQSSSSAQAPSEFSCVIWKSLGLGQIYYLNNDNYEPLGFRKGTRSDTFPLSGQGSLKLFTREEVEGELIYDLVGEGKLPASTQQILFLIRKNESNSGAPLVVLGIDDSSKSLPAGSYKVINFTNKQLELRVNQSTDRVKPRAVKVVRPDIPEKGGFLPFYIGDQVKGVIYETRLYCQRNAREIVFVFPSDGKRPISVKFLSQLVAVKPEESASR